MHTLTLFPTGGGQYDPPLDFFGTTFFRRPAGAPFFFTFSLDTKYTFWANIKRPKCIVHFLGGCSNGTSIFSYIFPY